MLATETDKHWNTGYVSGSFDMFHVGHLNLIRRAKERCGHLIVGVLTDELIFQRKGKWPVIPLDQRMEIIAALRYVDEVIVTTPDIIPRIAAWEKLRFDAFFTGDDWVDVPERVEEEMRLNELGADLVFFPYTTEVSTSFLQELTLPPKAEDADKAKRIGNFRHIFPFDKVNKGERVVIYGTGDVGGQYARQLSALAFCEIAAFADTYAKTGDMFEGTRCVSPEELSGNKIVFDRIVIASTSYYEAILDRLRASGIPPEKIV